MSLVSCFWCFVVVVVVVVVVLVGFFFCLFLPVTSELRPYMASSSNRLRQSLTPSRIFPKRAVYRSY